MPHQCTDCGRGFEDGSKEMLSGCPNCGGNTFQFQPDSDDAEQPSEPAEPPEPPESEVDSTVARTVGNAATAVRDLVGGTDRPADDRPSTDPTATDVPDSSGPLADTSPSSGDTVSSTGTDPTSSKDTRDRDTTSATNAPVSSGSRASNDITAETKSQENAAQASARSDVVSPDDLPPAPETSVRERPAPVVDEQSEREKDDQNEDRPDLDELREQLNEQFESIRVIAPGQYELNLMELYDREEYIIALQEDGKYTIQVPERWGE